MSESEGIAQAFVSARREARGLARYPGTIPATLAEAYAIQERAIALRGGVVGGWKVGRIQPPLDAHHGSKRLAGPIFADRILPAIPEATMPVFADGFGAAEAEFLLRIGSLPAAGPRLTPEEAATYIDAVHVGIEIASSPYPGINSDGPTVTISDFGNNHGLIVGPEVAGWRGGDFGGGRGVLSFAGGPAGEAIAADMLDGPFGAAAFLFALAESQGLPLRPGQWISSGAVTGVHQMKPGERAIARFGDAYEISCTIEAATAQRHEELVDERKSG